LRSFGQKSLEEVQERLETLDLKPKIRRKIKSRVGAKRLKGYRGRRR